jgi:hypothetical protein
LPCRASTANDLPCLGGTVACGAVHTFLSVDFANPLPVDPVHYSQSFSKNNITSIIHSLYLIADINWVQGSTISLEAWTGKTAETEPIKLLKIPQASRQSLLPDSCHNKYTPIQ